MSYNPVLLVANTILHHSFSANYPVTHMKLQKLIYFVFKQYLEDTGDALFDEPFLAWKNGPALRSVYDAYKSSVAANINHYMLFGDEKSPRIISHKNKEFHRAMNSVLSHYKKYTGTQLKGLASKSDGAWSKAVVRHEKALRKVDIWNERWYSL